MVRLSKEKTLLLVVSGTPACVEILRYFQGKGGWIQLPSELAILRANLRIEDYVRLYDDPRRIGVCILLAFAEPGELHAWGMELGSLTVVEQEQALEEFADSISEVNREIDRVFVWPRTGAERLKVKRDFEALSEDEQKSALRTGAFLWSAFLAGFHNILAVMIHGEPLTTLVAKAVAGDDASFCKAVQVDRQLYTHHPYFRRRIELATQNAEASFLRDVSYRLQAPSAKGKIRYPGLWTVFAILDTLGWLDGSLTAEDILDICDAAKLDRYENRIEDALYVSKRLRHYRKMQKTALLSSH